MITAKLNLSIDSHQNSTMFYKLSFITIVSSFVLSACSTSPVKPNSAVILEQHQNIQVEPSTQSNQARLIQQQDNCVIEFTGRFGTDQQATEYWIFKDNQLISAYTRVKTKLEKTETVFDINNTVQQENFSVLQKYFKATNLDKCNTTVKSN